MSFFWGALNGTTTMSTVLLPYRNNNVNTCDNLYVASMLATVFPNYVCSTCHTQLNSWLCSDITQNCCNKRDRSATRGARLASRNEQQYNDSASAEIQTEHLPNASRNVALWTNLFSPISPSLTSSPQKSLAKRINYTIFSILL